MIDIFNKFKKKGQEEENLDIEDIDLVDIVNLSEQLRVASSNASDQNTMSQIISISDSAEMTNRDINMNVLELFEVLVQDQGIIYIVEMFINEKCLFSKSKNYIFY